VTRATGPTRNVPDWHRRRDEELEALFGPFEELREASIHKDFSYNIGGLRDKICQRFEQGTPL
jgi:hypothetical protein